MSDKNQTSAVSLYYQPYKEQQMVHESTARYKILRLGRRSGKSKLAAAEIFRFILSRLNGKPLEIGWIGPNYRQAGVGIEAMKEIGRDLITSGMMTTMKTYPQTATISKHRVSFLSADAPDSIRGLHFDLLIVDEAAYIAEDTWYNAILPTIMDDEAPVLMLSTPAGKNGFFHTYCQRGISGEAGYEHFHWDAYKNPHISKTEIDELAAGMPELARKQEIFAEFLDDGEQLVGDLSRCDSKTPCTCVDRHIVIGLDLAKSHDYTVATACCLNCNTIVEMERYRKVEWDKQVVRIKEMYNRLNTVLIVVDSTGVGDPIKNQLEVAGLNVEGFKFTNVSKNNLIDSLVITIEQANIHWDFEKYPVYASEIATYQPQFTRTGMTTYNAKQGCFDDAVISLALVCWKIADTHIRPFVQALCDEKVQPDEWNEIEDSHFDWVDGGNDLSGL